MRSFAARHQDAKFLRPSGALLLRAAFERERPGADVLRDDAARADIGARPYRDRRDKRCIRSDERSLTDLPFFCLL